VTLRYLLDTSVVSEPALASPNARLIHRLEQRAAQCAIASPVWHELVYGAARLSDGRRRAALDYYLQGVVRERLPILPYDTDAAEWHARERARLEAAGRSPPFVDGQIAAIAATRNLILVTANRRDFAAFREVEVADWGR
jgi:tRNA(fMet)-specific endonuclease VapC